MQSRVRRFAHLMERFGLAMLGGTCGLFVAAHVGSSISFLSSENFLRIMMIAEAHDASRPELDGWYEKLESRKGPCCDGSDSAHVEPSDWETQNKPRSHYKVRLDGVWADVPDEAVVTGPNRDGRTLVWYYDGWTGHSGIPGKVIKCFMPGTMT